MSHHLKYLFTLIFGFILFPFFPNAQYQKNNTPKFSNENIIALNKNHFFRFNDELHISFNATLLNGYDQYLENLVQISDLNKNNIDIVLSLENSSSELLFITNDRLIRRKINFDKEHFTLNNVNFDFNFNLKEDKVTIAINNSILSENNLGLKPNTDYKVTLGGKSSNQKSMIRFHDVNTEPDLLDEKEFKIFNQKSLYWFLIILVLDIVAFGLYLRFRSAKKRASIKLEQKSTFSENETEEPVYQKNENSITKKNKITVSAVYLFKEFQVYDNKGKDITRQFTPLLKELFLLLLLHSQKREKGISTNLLKEILWYDKNTHSANNNKAVNIGKLKTIFKNIGNFDIVNDISHTSLHLKNDIYCDYYRILSLLGKDYLSKEEIIEVIEITERGGFLQECHYEWLDSFKADISEMVIDNLLNFSEQLDINHDSKLIIKIADAVFNFDNLNEKALSLKCKALIIVGKHSMATKTYSAFVNNYEKLYQTVYNLTFVEIIARHPTNSY